MVVLMMVFGTKVKAKATFLPVFMALWGGVSWLGSRRHPERGFGHGGWGYALEVDAGRARKDRDRSGCAGSPSCLGNRNTGGRVGRGLHRPEARSEAKLERNCTLVSHLALGIVCQQPNRSVGIDIPRVKAVENFRSI